MRGRESNVKAWATWEKAPENGKCQRESCAGRRKRKEPHGALPYQTHIY